MEVYRTFDINDIQALYSLPDIQERIRIDGVDVLSAMNPDLSKGLFFVLLEDNIQVGLILLEIRTNTSVAIHGGILPEHRKKAREYTDQAITILFSLYPIMNNMISEVPSKHKSTYNFMKKCNFKEVGVLTNNVKIDDVLYDTLILQRGR